jgi:hypothetical protein
MKLLYLSPHFPLHFTQFTESLARYGVQVLGVTDQPDECLPEVLKRTLAGHYRVDSLNCTDQVLAAGHFFRERWGPIDRVESHLEPWLELEAIVRQELDVPGFRPDQLQFLKKKSLMKDVFLRAKVPTARGMVVTTFEETRDFINGKYPAFIKPDIGVGASDTFTIRSEDDLRRFFAVRKEYPYFLEEFLDGVIESFDGLTDRDGNVVFFASHLFNYDIHKIVTENRNLYYYSARDIPSDLSEYGHRVVAAAGIREKFFHIEFFRLPDGTLRGLELNVRVPGGLTSHMFNYACDVDVYDWWARIVARGDSRQPYQRKYHCAFIGKKYNRVYRREDDDIRRELGDGLMTEYTMSPIEFDVMGHRGWLVRAPDLDQLHSMINLILEEADR